MSNLECLIFGTVNSNMASKMASKIETPLFLTSCSLTKKIHHFFAIRCLGNPIRLHHAKDLLIITNVLDFYSP